MGSFGLIIKVGSVSQFIPTIHRIDDNVFLIPTDTDVSMELFTRDINFNIKRTNEGYWFCTSNIHGLQSMSKHETLNSVIRALGKFIQSHEHDYLKTCHSGYVAKLLQLHKKDSRQYEIANKVLTYLSKN